MRSKITYRRSPLPKEDTAENTIHELEKGNQSNKSSPEGNIGSVTSRKQGLRYFEGRSEAGKNKPYLPSEAGAMPDNEADTNPGRADYPPYPGGPGNDLGEVRDLSTKTPYGRPGMGWSENTEKLSKLYPMERDQPTWAQTWSECLESEGDEQGPNGVGVTLDENYYVPRPRTFQRQREAFQEYNPEFQDVADHGDWTSYKWDRNV